MYHFSFYITNTISKLLKETTIDSFQTKMFKCILFLTLLDIHFPLPLVPVHSWYVERSGFSAQLPKTKETWKQNGKCLPNKL